MTLYQLGIIITTIMMATVVVVPDQVICFTAPTRTTSTKGATVSKTPTKFIQQEQHQTFRTRTTENISMKNENDSDTSFADDNSLFFIHNHGNMMDEHQQVTISPGTTSSTSARTTRNGRRTFFDHSVGSVLATAIAIFGTTFTTATDVAIADVSDGTSLPDGAQQFARVVRLKSDLIAVQKRLKNANNGSSTEIDTKEWDNIGKFLRTIYSVADGDMKFISKGIVDTDRKNSASVAIDQMKKYAQAGDVSVSKKDTTNLSIIMEKCIQLTQTFLDALSDVPDEL